MKKLSFIVAILCTSMMAFADAAPSGELFATYQKQGETFYNGSGEANLEAESYTVAVNYYIVTCGDSVLLRATTTEDHNFTAGWQTQLRIWTGAYVNSNEIQTNAGGGTKNCYTSICRNILPTTEDVKVHLLLDWWSGNGVTQTIEFNRASINNPIVDAVAPTITPSDVTMTEDEGNGKLIFTFGTVTASEPYFYYVADKDHNIGGISLENKVYITKPTVEDGTTYTFKCYAVDYNGNKSAYKEFELQMPFDENLDLAYKKSCIAGYTNGGDTPDKAVNGENDHWGTYGISDYTLNWWQVDLNNAYNLSEIDVELEYSNSYKIEGSTDGSNWTEIIRSDDNPAAGTLTKYTGLYSAARYLKLTALQEKMISIRHFKVYASGIAPDGGATAIDNTIAGEKAVKVIENGQLVIIKNGVKYNVLGKQL